MIALGPCLVIKLAPWLLVKWALKLSCYLLTPSRDQEPPGPFEATVETSKAVRRYTLAWIGHGYTTLRTPLA